MELTEERLAVHGQVRTHRIAWRDLRLATAAPMRTASPLRKRFPYVALTLELSDGQRRQFEEVAAAESDRARVDAIVDAINAKL